MTLAHAFSTVPMTYEKIIGNLSIGRRELRLHQGRQRQPGRKELSMI